MPQQEFSLERLNELLGPRGFDIVSAEPITEGKANTNLRVETAKGETYLFRSHQRDSESGVIESKIASLLANETFVPKVIFHDPQGASSLVEWKPGRSIEALMGDGEEEEVGRAARSIGRALARISAYTFPVAGFFDAELHVSEPWASAGAGIGGHVLHLLEQPKMRARLSFTEIARLRSIAQRLAAELDAAWPVPALCHSDFKASNLLVHEGRLSAVVDWEFAHSGSPGVALGQLFRHALPDGFEKSFAAAYRAEGGNLPKGWRELARRADLVNLLDFMNRSDLTKDWEEDLRRLISKTV